MKKSTTEIRKTINRKLTEAREARMFKDFDRFLVLVGRRSRAQSAVGTDACEGAWVHICRCSGATRCA